MNPLALTFVSFEAVLKASCFSQSVIHCPLEGVLNWFDQFLSAIYFSYKQPMTDITRDRSAFHKDGMIKKKIVTLIGTMF